jgi:hypothetical protein
MPTHPTRSPTRSARGDRGRHDAPAPRRCRTDPRPFCATRPSLGRAWCGAPSCEPPTCEPDPRTSVWRAADPCRAGASCRPQGPPTTGEQTLGRPSQPSRSWYSSECLHLDSRSHIRTVPLYVKEASCLAWRSVAWRLRCCCRACPPLSPGGPVHRHRRAVPTGSRTAVPACRSGRAAGTAGVVGEFQRFALFLNTASACSVTADKSSKCEAQADRWPRMGAPGERSGGQEPAGPYRHDQRHLHDSARHLLAGALA